MLAVGILGALSNQTGCQKPIDYTALVHEARERADVRVGALKSCLEAADQRHWADMKSNGTLRPNGSAQATDEIWAFLDRQLQARVKVCFREYGPVADPGLAVLPKEQP